MTTLRRIPGVRAIADRLDLALRWRIDAATGAVGESVQELRQALAEQHGEIEAVRLEVAELRARVDGFGPEVERLRHKADWAESVTERLAPQVSAIESRMADVEAAASRAASLGTTDTGTGGAPERLLAEIEKQHAVVRARLSALAVYEDRLRRLEEG